MSFVSSNGISSNNTNSPFKNIATNTFINHLAYCTRPIHRDVGVGGDTMGYEGNSYPPGNLTECCSLTNEAAGSSYTWMTTSTVSLMDI